MTIEGLLIGILIVLVIMVLLALSIVKGIANIIEQQASILEKHTEWMNDIYDVMYAVKEESKVIIGEEPTKQQKDMFENGLKKFNQ
jgi:predicted PurR-regulated permease PerM